VWCQREDGLFVDCSSVSHSQEDDLLRSVVDPVDDAIVAQSEAVASFELAAEPLSGVGLGFKGPNLFVDAVLEGWKPVS